MRFRPSCAVLFSLLVCTVLIPPWQDRLAAQEARGAIVGRVVDPSGAVVPGAALVVSNKAMGTILYLRLPEHPLELLERRRGDEMEPDYE
jgi:hypothetical protein